MAVFRFSAIKGYLTSPPSSGITPSFFSEEAICKYGPQEELSKLSLRKHLQQQVDEYMNGGVNIGPIVFLIHGNGFNPLDKNERSIHSTNPNLCLYNSRGYAWKKATRLNRYSWPNSLHLDYDAIEEEHGLGIAFGWKSNGKFRELYTDYIDQAEKEAHKSAYALAQLFLAIIEIAPEAPLHFFCHGMGAKVFFTMCSLLKEAAPDLSPFSHLKSVQFLGALESSAQGQQLLEDLEQKLPHNTPSFYNFMHSEDDYLNLYQERFERLKKQPIQILGLNGISKKKNPHWIDIDLNHSQVTKWFRRVLLVDAKVKDPENIRDHHYYYKHLPNMALFRSIIWEKEGFSIASFRKQNIPEGKKNWWEPLLEALLGID